MLKSLNFILLHVANLDEVLTFYTQKLGFIVEAQSPFFVQFKQAPGGAIFSLSKSENATTYQGVELWWDVDDVDATLAALQAQGIEIAQPLKDEPFGRTFAIKDPAGNKIFILQYTL
jgi:predicted enzyme related to lactoylglutathione lyase